jgi:Spirocyclase AveC-like
MAGVSTTVRVDHRKGLPVSAPQGRVPAAVILAVIGALVAGYALWTWGAWLASGPSQVTANRDPESASRWVARGYEALMVVVAAVLAVRVVRECLRERRLVFDAVMVIAGFFTLFWDPMVNWMQPNFMYSCQWLNLNTWVANAPGVVNPTGSLMPQPVFIMLIYPFGLLGFAMILNWAMTRFRRRFPRVSNLELLAFTYAFGWVLGVGLEAPMFLANLWGLPGAPAGLSLFSDAHRFAWAEYLTTAIVFTTFAAVRFFRDDKGRAISERGLGGLNPVARSAVSVFATIAIFAMAMWALLLVQIPAGLHSSPYPAGYPAHLINGLCNIPGNPHSTQPTAYGPCPGSPGFRMPVKNTFVSGARG